jgi:hypothetical protein
MRDHSCCWINFNSPTGVKSKFLAHDTYQKRIWLAIEETAREIVTEVYEKLLKLELTTEEIQEFSDLREPEQPLVRVNFQLNLYIEGV